MNRLGKSEIYYGRVVPFEDEMRKLNAVTSNDVHQLAQAIFPADASGLAITAIGPFDEKDQIMEAEEDEEDGE